MKLQSKQSEHQTSNAKKDSHRICLSGGEGNGGFNGTGEGRRREEEERKRKQCGERKKSSAECGSAYS